MMNTKNHFFPKKQPGQSLVELGLSLMIILWLLSGAVDFGIGFFSYVAIRDAAQEGALYGSINPTGNIEARVRSSSSAPVNLADASIVHIVVTPPAAPVCAGKSLKVEITYDYPILMALMNTITGPTIHIRASSTSVILVPACP